MQEATDDSLVSVNRASQVVPALTSEEDAVLKVEIASSGVQAPAVFEQDGTVTDSHNRVAMANELAGQFVTAAFAINGVVTDLQAVTV